jgi:hypothetical protein
MTKKKEPRRVAVIDLETDPFKYGRLPKPFAAGFFDGETYQDFWGADCCDQLLKFLAHYPEPLLIYAHNGGKFDFFYIFDMLENPVKIINGRIVSAMLGKHEMRDSYAIIPVPLSAYKKDEIDYRIFEADSREKPENKSEILHYLAKDCEYTFRLVSAFVERFGTKLTIGSTAIAKLRELHDFRRGTETHDEAFRGFYFGGRVQAFHTGVIPGNWKIFDVNSMYPHVMRNCLHPTGLRYANVANPKLTPEGNMRGFGERPYFVEVEGINRGALPVRTKEGLDFTCERGIFRTMSHELKTALKHKLFKVEKIHTARVPHQSISFGDYVDTYVAEKIAAKQCGDKVTEIFSKLLLNSAYGKFGQNPDNYFDYMIIRDLYELPQDEYAEGLWGLYELHGDFAIWRKKSDRKAYFDVATAASITSASRAMLLDAIATAKNPIYCDTDSIICESFAGTVHESALGAWKCEGEADTLAIAGKKLYAAFKDGECIKSANKGVRLTPQEIVKLCRGGSVTWQNQAPSFSIANKGGRFVERVLTGKKKGV